MVCSPFIPPCVWQPSTAVEGAVICSCCRVTQLGSNIKRWGVVVKPGMAGEGIHMSLEGPSVFENDVERMDRACGWNWEENRHWGVGFPEDCDQVHNKWKVPRKLLNPATKGPSSPRCTPEQQYTWNPAQEREQQVQKDILVARILLDEDLLGGGSPGGLCRRIKDRRTKHERSMSQHVACCNVS